MNCTCTTRVEYIADIRITYVDICQQCLLEEDKIYMDMDIILGETNTTVLWERPTATEE